MTAHHDVEVYADRYEEEQKVIATLCRECREREIEEDRLALGIDHCSHCRRQYLMEEAQAGLL